MTRYHTGKAIACHDHNAYLHPYSVHLLMVNPVEPSHGITTAPASAPCKSRPMDHILPSHMICSALSSRARSKSAVSSKSSQDSGVSRPTNTLSHRHAEPVQEREEKSQNKKPTLPSNSPSSASGTATSNSTSHHAAQPNPTQRKPQPRRAPGDPVPPHDNLRSR